MRRIETHVLEEWMRADESRRAIFSARVHVSRSCASGALEEYYQIDPKDSWMIAAAEKNLPMFVPGWEDSTLGNMFAGALHRGRREERAHRAHRHRVHDRAGRVVHATRAEEARSASSRSAAASPAISRSAWCRCCIRICSATTCRSGDTSARSAIRPRATARIPARCRTRRSPGESSASTRRKFIIESDATIVAPLIFAYVLGW